MIKRVLIILIFIFAGIPAFALKINLSSGVYGGFIPALGGNLDSMNQYIYFNSANGIEDINRDKEGYATDNIRSLSGAYTGFELKALFFDYYLLRLGANYYMGVYGGAGKTVFSPDAGTNYYILECEYSFKGYDIPFTLGVSVPFWKDVRLSLSCGVAYASARYRNKFKSDDNYPDPFERKGSFKGWAMPLVIIIQGEYFLSRDISLTSALSYYKGTTEVFRDGITNDTEGFGGQGAVDYARIDFSGYRYSIGASYYFTSI